MSNLSDFYEKPPSAVGHYRRLKEQELQAQVAPVVHAAALAVEMFGYDELERYAAEQCEPIYPVKNAVRVQDVEDNPVRRCC